MKRFLISITTFFLTVSITVAATTLASFTGDVQVDALKGQEVRFRGRAVRWVDPPGCFDCYVGWDVNVTYVVSGPPIAGTVGVVVGGGYEGCSGGYVDWYIGPGDQVEVYGALASQPQQDLVFVCGGSPWYYIRRVTTFRHQVFLPVVLRGRY